MPSKSRESIEKVDNWWWMAARMWLQFDWRTTAGVNCRDLTDRMGHHTWVLAIMEFKVKGINRKSWQLMMHGGENVITVWLAYNGRSKLRPDQTEDIWSDGSPHLSTIMEFKVKGINRKSWQLMMDENVITVWLVYNDTSKLQRPDWTKGVWPNGSPRLSGYNWGT